MTGKKNTGSSEAACCVSFLAAAVSPRNMNAASSKTWGESGSSAIARVPSAIDSSNRPWNASAMPN